MGRTGWMTQHQVRQWVTTRRGAVVLMPGGLPLLNQQMTNREAVSPSLRKPQ